MLDEIIKNKVDATLSECDKHLNWMTSAHQHIQNYFPLTKEKYHDLDEEIIPHVDQYLYRFTKLQDTMGSRLFDLVLILLEENVKSMSFLDKLNKLEQLNLLSGRDIWLDLRNLRNRAAHEYDDLENTEILNSLFESKDKLINIYTVIKQKVNSLAQN